MGPHMTIYIHGTRRLKGSCIHSQTLVLGFPPGTYERLSASKQPSVVHICRRRAALLVPLTSVKTEYQSPEVRAANIPNASRQIHCIQACKKKLHPNKWAKKWLSSRLTIGLLILEEQYQQESSKPKTEPEQLRKPLIVTISLATASNQQEQHRMGGKTRVWRVNTSEAQEQKQGQSLTMEHDEKPPVEAEVGNHDSLLTNPKVTPEEFENRGAMRVPITTKHKHSLIPD